MLNCAAGRISAGLTNTLFSAVDKESKRLRDGPERSYLRRKGAASFEVIEFDESEIDSLIDMLDEASALIRRTAVRTLGSTGDHQAVPPLIGALSEEERYVAREAADALKRLTNKDFGPDPEKWKRWYRKRAATRGENRSRSSASPWR